MCLDVQKSYVRNPIPEMACFKVLEYGGNGKWITPYYDVNVPVDTGWIMPLKPARRQVREYRKDEGIEGGYIHAYIEKNVSFWRSPDYKTVYSTLPTKPKKNSTYIFAAVARDVVATGDSFDKDLVCKALYIPAFDKSGKNRNAVLDMSR